MRCMYLWGSASCISKEDTLQTQRRFWKGFQQYNVVNFVVSSCIVGALILHFADVTPSAQAKEAHHVQSVVSPTCVHPISSKSVQSETLSTSHTQHTSTKLDTAQMKGEQRTQRSDTNHNLIPTDQRCISGNASQSDQNPDRAYKMSIATNASFTSKIPYGLGALTRLVKPAIHFVSQKGNLSYKPLPSASQNILNGMVKNVALSTNMLQGSVGNVFPYGQCTWWANQRYHQLYGIFVPWRTNANAFQWVARAVDFGWHVSGTPSIGSIIVLQPYVDGAYGFGHVGVVEQILTNGRVIASSMNWGNHPGTVTLATYVLGSGVSFISRN